MYTQTYNNDVGMPWKHWPDTLE